MRNTVRARFLRSAMMLAVLALGGCSAVEFYWQGIAGQMSIVASARPIPDVVAATDDALLRERLLQIQAIRAFATRELALPDNGSYTRYANLHRSFAVWNVFAAPELSLEPREWCFPVAGCVAYRGYFSEGAALAEAARLRERGDDVHVAGVAAYSTLGWFDDPVLSTFVRFREVELARLVFHELAHQVAYVKDDTTFNESFAVAVEEEGLRRWLAAQAGRADAAALREEAARGRRLRSDFRSLLRQARERLVALYASDVPAEARRQGKAAVFAELRAGYERAKAGWGGIPAFDRWFAGGANNAGIAAAGLYEDRVAAFVALMASQGGVMADFYAEVRRLGRLPKAERNARLAALASVTAAASSAAAPARDPASAAIRHDP